jgi:hypothetical protein
MSGRDSLNKRGRLVMPRREESLPRDWQRNKDVPFEAQIVSIHTGDISDHSLLPTWLVLACYLPYRIFSASIPKVVLTSTIPFYFSIISSQKKMFKYYSNMLFMFFLSSPHCVLIEVQNELTN